MGERRTDGSESPLIAAAARHEAAHARFKALAAQLDAARLETPDDVCATAKIMSEALAARGELTRAADAVRAALALFSTECVAADRWLRERCDAIAARTTALMTTGQPAGGPS